MRPVNPKQFYMTQWAYEDPTCVTRMQRLMQGFGAPEDRVQILDEAALAQAITENDWHDLDIRQGREDFTFAGDPDIVFNRFRWMSEDEMRACVQRNPVLDELKGYSRGAARALYGFPDFYHREGRDAAAKHRVNCWTLHDLHSARGCFHKCQYCRRGRMTTLMLDIEDFLEHVDQLLAENPWQKVTRYDVETDCLILEPEYGMCRALVEHFAEKDDRYIILFSKSDNVDFLLDLEHRGHTIMLWTLSTPMVAQRIELETATTEERLIAARKCQDAGYTVRFKFKPIIPIADWRADATAMIEMLFDYVEPDNLSMEMLFFNSTAELEQLFSKDLFDPDFYRLMTAHEIATGLPDGLHVIPHDFRAMVYTHYAKEVQRVNPNARLALCAETKAMWTEMAPLLGQTAAHFVCNCSPASVPGARGDQIYSEDGGIPLFRD